MKAGKIAVCILALLIGGSCQLLLPQKPPISTGGKLEVELRMPEPWKHIIIGPSQQKEYPKVPSRFSMFMTGEPTNALKPWLIIEDSTGVEHSILLTMSINNLMNGKVLTLNLKDARKTSQNIPGVLPLHTIKPPIKIKGIRFVCRKPLRDTVIYIDNMSFDGRVVEDFESDTHWKVIVKQDKRSKCNLRVSQGPVPGRAMKGFKIPEPFPERESSLTSNFNFEKDSNQDGKPDGWAHANRDNLVPFDSFGKPLLDPAHYEGKITWENIGAESPRSVAVSVEKEDSWAAVATVLKDIQPHTDYTVSLWYRQAKAGDTVLMIFGTRVRMDRHLTLNAEHWIRYSGIFSSGGFSGDCAIAVGVVNPPEPTRIYVDKVEVYEGVSPIGYNRARMYHPYYSFAEISPDIVSYVPFSYECLFAKNKRPREVRYILELPADVSVETSAGWYMRRSYKWFTWRRKAPYRTRKEEIIRDGKPYIRHSVILPAWKATDERSLVNYVVPVGIRDSWKGCLGRYCGQVNLAFGLSTRLTEGTRKAYYYAKWEGGQQEPEELELRVVRVPEVKHQLKRMVCLVDANPFSPEQFPDMIPILRHIGANGLAGGSRREWGPGMQYYATWINFPMYHSSGPEAMAMGPDGKRGTGGRAQCMSYRGPGWKKYMAGLFKKIEQGYNVFMFDDARAATCFCDKCKAEFANMLKEHTRLPYIDPAKFMAPGWKGPAEYRKLWHDFQLWIYGVAAQAMKDEMIEYARKRDKNAQIYFLQSARPVRPTHAFAYAPAHKAFDFEGMQAYIYCYHQTYQGSPKRIGDQLHSRQEAAGKYANPMVPTLSPGLTYMHPVCSLDPHAQMKYQILEAAMAHKALGYNMYAGSGIDLGDLRYMAEANEILSRFEDIFVDGEVVKGVKVLGTNASARAKQLGEHVLLLVSDYSTYQSRMTEVTVSLPEPLADKFTDVETGEQLVPSSEGLNLMVTLSDRRARLFYGGPGLER